MDFDVQRVCAFEIDLTLDDMSQATDRKELREMTDLLKDQVESYFNALAARLED